MYLPKLSNPTLSMFDQSQKIMNATFLTEFDSKFLRNHFGYRKSKTIIDKKCN